MKHVVSYMIRGECWLFAEDGTVPRVGEFVKLGLMPQVWQVASVTHEIGAHPTGITVIRVELQDVYPA